ncbi:HK97 family phage prohead protease [Cryobacterium sp. 10S3]|uniref:HK97 family phage prohead protease n=1 Tax=Cryobacterium sp. 10S3 TaxID=3048582 RepID=UPI002AC91E8A|nr:HK97 family phage prohead protease [Cryobacterium sp. 10S3]MEB0286166.1 HK97 family phage prohead protease [Cryobacterium sp. 10S3]WPX12224.1 HK97 family phage prohead protease [Cryobacterium sp. 10S3]
MPETPEVERRTFDRPIHLRAAPEGANGPGILTGYGAVFNSESRDLGGYVEVIDPGVFDTIGEGDARMIDTGSNGRVLCRFNHDSNGLLGTTNAGTLRLFVDDIGVRYEVDLPDTQHGRDMAELARRGDLAFSSFAFRILPNGRTWRENASGQLVAVITRAVLVDVAPVADPAYWGSSAEMRAAVDLDAIRASLKTTDTEARASEVRAVAIGRARQITILTERNHK